MHPSVAVARAFIDDGADALEEFGITVLGGRPHGV
jgi:hypothetical protein